MLVISQKKAFFESRIVRSSLQGVFGEVIFGKEKESLAS